MPRQVPPDLFGDLADFEVDFFVNLVKSYAKLDIGMRGFFFHPRLRLAGGEVFAPGQPDDDGEPVEFWELRVEDDEGSQVILRLSETAMRGLLRQLREALTEAL